MSRNINGHTGSYVYVIYQTGSHYFKIGITNDLDRRLSQLQVGNPQKLEIKYRFPCVDADAAADIETMLHNNFAGGAMRGEWFVLNQAQVDGIAMTAKIAHQSAMSAKRAIVAKIEARAWDAQHYENLIEKRSAEGLNVALAA